MPRIRSIKPEFFTSEATAALSLRARLTWIGLWTHCDDQGRCRDHPRLIHAALYPLDADVAAVDVATDLDELAAGHRIQRYTVAGRHYLAITNWDEHQKPNRPQKSKRPGPDQADERPPAHEASTHAAPAPPPSDEYGAGTASAEPGQPGRCTHTEDSVPTHCAATDRKAHGEPAAQADSHTDAADIETSQKGHGTRSEGSRTTQCTVTGGVVAGSRGDGAGETEKEREANSEGREPAATRLPDDACTDDSQPVHRARSEDSRTTQCAITGGVVAGSRGDGAGETEREVEVEVEVEVEGREPAATRIPADFAVTTEMLAWAREHTPAVGRTETDKFLDYWRARADPGAVKRDWVATWRNWMRRTQQDHDRHAPHHGPRKSTKDDRVQALDAFLTDERDTATGDLRAIPGGAA